MIGWIRRWKRRRQYLREGREALAAAEHGVRAATVESDGWRLVSAEEHAERYPEFQLPARSRRESLTPGDAAKLMFDIETREDGQVVDRGVDRMWVLVKSRTEAGYLGVLDSDPGFAENLELVPGLEIAFTADHVIDIDRPPRHYIEAKYGPAFFR